MDGIHPSPKVLGFLPSKDKMAHFIERQPSRSQNILEGLLGGLQGASLGGQEIKNALREREERNALQENFGDIFGHIHSPDMRKQLLQGALTQKERAQELKLKERDYQVIEKFFGKDAADLYKAFTTGGQTDLAKSLLDSLERGENFNEMLSGVSSPTIENEPRPPIEEINKKGELELPDYTQRPKGFTKKGWDEERKRWTKSNAETLTASRDRLKATKRDILGTKKAINLNESHKLPEDFGRIIVDPNTGGIRPLAQLAGLASPETQEFVKELARFGNRAKDAFGSRVTNFDLAQYMKQFPSLLNTYEGRKRILRMMEINYELDSLYDNAVRKILDKKGAAGLPPEELDRLARGMIATEEERLFDEYLKNESENESEFLREGNRVSGKRSLEEIFG